MTEVQHQHNDTKFSDGQLGFNNHILPPADANGIKKLIYRLTHRSGGNMRDAARRITAIEEKKKVEETIKKFEELPR